MQDRSDEPQHIFPTHPAFLVPVEIKDADPVIYGETGHKGVFTTSDIPKGKKDIWVWTDRVIAIHHNELDAYIEKNFGNDNKKNIQIFLRQGFIHLNHHQKKEKNKKTVVLKVKKIITFIQIRQMLADLPIIVMNLILVWMEHFVI